MKWLWVAITVVAGSIGDVLSAQGMARRVRPGEAPPPGIAGTLGYIFTHPLVMAGIAANAVSFISFMALLAVSELSFAVPVTALGYIVRILLARVYLSEYVNWKRWAGAVLVAAGVLLVSI